MPVLKTGFAPGGSSMIKKRKIYKGKTHSGLGHLVLLADSNTIGYIITHRTESPEGNEIYTTPMLITLTVSNRIHKLLSDRMSLPL